MPLRLVPATDEGGPAGLRLTRSNAAALLGRIAPRIARYAALRLTLAGGGAVLFAREAASERNPLPWCEKPLGWLAAAGPLLHPHANETGSLVFDGDGFVTASLLHRRYGAGDAPILHLRLAIAESGRPLTLAAIADGYALGSKPNQLDRTRSRFRPRLCENVLLW